jgi:predicted O-methyltransferase YrrM
MGVGLGLRAKARNLANEARYLWANGFGRPSLYRRASAERVGACFAQPSDMCVTDRLMLYGLVRGLRPSSVLEIGVRWGGGARIIAAALEDVGGHGRAVGLDPSPQQFRAPARSLYGRYEIMGGRSPDDVPAAAKRLNGQLDMVVIDALHTYEYARQDIEAVLPHLARGAHILLHDAYHQGIARAAQEAIERSDGELVDLGILTREPQIRDAPVAYQGWRVLRVGPACGRSMITQAFADHGRACRLNPEFDNWDVSIKGAGR